LPLESPNASSATPKRSASVIVAPVARKTSTMAVKKERGKSGSVLSSFVIDDGSHETVVEQIVSYLVKEKVRILDLFHEWDSEGGGTITRDEFRKALPRLGVHMAKDKVEDLFRSLDVETKGEFTYQQLTAVVRKTQKELKLNESLWKAKAVDIKKQLSAIKSLRGDQIIFKGAAGTADETASPPAKSGGPFRTGSVADLAAAAASAAAGSHAS